MKIKPEIYAKTLLSLLENGTKPEEISPLLWRTLQKNKQSKDLPKILDLLDKEYATQNKLGFAKIFSKAPLSEEELEKVKSKLTNKFNQKIFVRNEIKSNCIAGIIVKMDDTEIDLSVEEKIRKMEQTLQA